MLFTKTEKKNSNKNIMKYLSLSLYISPLCNYLSPISWYPANNTGAHWQSPNSNTSHQPSNESQPSHQEATSLWLAPHHFMAFLVMSVICYRITPCLIYASCLSSTPSPAATLERQYLFITSCPGFLLAVLSSFGNNQNIGVLVTLCYLTRWMTESVYKQINHNVP